MANIALLLIATGKYDIFLAPLFDSIQEHFFKNDIKNIYLFSDMNSEWKPPGHSYWHHVRKINIQQIYIHHQPFPLATLNRYCHFNNIRERLYEDRNDYVFYCDVDMLFVDDVDKEILPNGVTDNGLVAVRHPGFINGGWGSPNVNPLSKAFVPEDERGIYFAGGFQGGMLHSYMEMCNILYHAIETDKKNGVMAEWHDESHFNKYLSVFDSNPRVLGHEYCMPDDNITGNPKILALSKDHNALRF